MGRGQFLRDVSLRAMCGPSAELPESSRRAPADVSDISSPEAPLGVDLPIHRSMMSTKGQDPVASPCALTDVSAIRLLATPSRADLTDIGKAPWWSLVTNRIGQLPSPRVIRPRSVDPQRCRRPLLIDSLSRRVIRPLEASFDRPSVDIVGPITRGQSKSLTATRQESRSVYPSARSRCRRRTTSAVSSVGPWPGSEAGPANVPNWRSPASPSPGTI